MSMSNSRPYQYKRLRGREIRLLRLKRPSLLQRLVAKIEPDAPELILEHISLDHAPQFEAISYTWDGQTLDQTIECGGKLLRTTKNCLRLLQVLRGRPCQRFWIDAICIDQVSDNSVLEKNSQLPMMGEIYQRADTVVVWLGEGTPESEKTFDLWQDIWIEVIPHMIQPAFVQAALKERRLSGVPDDVLQRTSQRRAQFEALNRQRYGRAGTAECNMMSDVLKRKWFSRMWTVQELVMGKDPVILCGRSSVTWGKFYSAFMWLVYLEKIDTKETINELRLLNYIDIHRNLRIRVQPHMQVVREVQADLSMTTILSETIVLFCSDPRDKLYALYGVFAALGITNLPTVDYRKTIVEVYTEASRKAIEQDRSLDILCRLGSRRVTHGLPSWTIDLNGQPAPRTFHRRCTASDGSKPSFLFTADGSLFTSGKIIDRIKKRAGMTLPLDHDLAITRHAGFVPRISEALPLIRDKVRAYEEWVKMGLTTSARYPTPLDAFTAFRTVILQGGFRSNDRPEKIDQETLDTFQHWCSLLLAVGPARNAAVEQNRRVIDEVAEVVALRPATRALYFSGDVDPATITATREWKVLMALMYTEARRIHLHINERMIGHTLFYTEAGSMGVGSDLIQDGDSVVLVSGLSVPMVVRANADGSSAFVGPAYIDGMMDGEQWCEEEAVDLQFK